MSVLLSVKGLGVCFRTRREQRPLVSDVGFELREGSVLGVLGESGSGKSITFRAVTGLLGESFAVRGDVLFNGRNLRDIPPGEMRAIRGRQIAMILQNPASAFDPLCTIGDQLMETFQAHLALGREACRQLAVSTLGSMLIPEPQALLHAYPHQLSGGMLQRVMIGLTLALRPALIIADEPTTALDSVTQHEILRELARIRSDLKTSMVFISHDLGALRMLAEHVLVMHAGRAVEYGLADEVFASPAHPHTRYLIETRRQLTTRFLELTGGARACPQEAAHAAG